MILSNQNLFKKMLCRTSLRIVAAVNMFLTITAYSSAQSTWNLVGNATSTGNDCFRLTKNVSNQRGAAWSNTLLNLKKPFDIYFQLNFGTNNNGADGITVVLQKSLAGTSALADAGMNLGYASTSIPIDPSIDIEFDTYQNIWPANDIADDHCAINGNGSISWTLASPVPILGPGISVEDNLYHLVQVDWKPSSSTLSVYFDCSLLQTLTYDLGWIFGSDSLVYYGLTSATGNANNSQYFCELYLNAGADSSFCPGAPVTLNGNTNFSSYSWSPSQGLSCTNCLNPVADPNDSITYVLTASYGCLTATDEIKLNTNCTVLPIELVSFTASCEKNHNELKWNTASEFNNNYFVLERSGDANNFQVIATIDGAGNSPTAHNYLFTDEQPLSGTNYYRLKQVDFDGTSTYSNTQSVTCTSELGLFVYPNPSRDETHLQIQSSSAKTVTCIVTNLSGRIISQQAIRLNEGSTEILLDNHKMIPGIYDVSIISCDKVLHSLLVIQ